MRRRASSRPVLKVLLPAVGAACVLTHWLGLYVGVGALHGASTCAGSAGTRGRRSSLVSVGVPGRRPSSSSRSGSSCPCRRARSRPGWATERDGAREPRSSASRSRSSRYNLVLAVIGIALGTIIGVLPGLGGANGVAILLPLTFTMPPTSAIILLTSLYWGALFGGAITSILFNIPGEPWSVATTFDGYPDGAAGAGRAGADRGLHLVVRRGALRHRPDHALRAAPRRGRAQVRAAGVLRHPAPDLLVASSGWAAAARSSRSCPSCIGFILAAVGLDIVTGQLRLTFGITELMKGFDFIVAVIGLFGIGEILLTMEEGLRFQGRAGRDATSRVVWQTWQDPAALLADLPAQLLHRVLDGLQAGRRHARLVHELRLRQALLASTRSGSARARSRASWRRRRPPTRPAAPRCCP